MIKLDKIANMSNKNSDLIVPNILIQLKNPLPRILILRTKPSSFPSLIMWLQEKALIKSMNRITL